jgi:hypothetical protein
VQSVSLVRDGFGALLQTGIVEGPQDLRDPLWEEYRERSDLRSTLQCNTHARRVDILTEAGINGLLRCQPSPLSATVEGKFQVAMVFQQRAQSPPRDPGLGGDLVNPEPSRLDLRRWPPQLTHGRDQQAVAAGGFFTMVGPVRGYGIENPTHDSRIFTPEDRDGLVQGKWLRTDYAVDNSETQMSEG